MLWYTFGDNWTKCEGGGAEKKGFADGKSNMAEHHNTWVSVSMILCCREQLLSTWSNC